MSTQYVIKKEDVGKGAITPVKFKCKHCGHSRMEYPFHPFGRVQKIDVGMTCYRVYPTVWQIKGVK